MQRQLRKVKTIIEPAPVVEGAGVRLKRSLGGEKLNYLDPFLLFDHFGSANAEDYQAGFPMHHHRGIETVTYMLTGEVHHRDTLGNTGSIGAGDVQWMTAGGGILHEEMPQVRPEGNAGFQLWVNLPARLKMTQPRYQDISSYKIPEVTTDDGANIRVIAGNVGGNRGCRRRYRCGSDVSGCVHSWESFVHTFNPSRAHRLCLCIRRTSGICRGRGRNTTMDCRDQASCVGRREFRKDRDR